MRALSHERYERIETNFRFLAREVSQQVERVRQYVEAPSKKLRKAIVSRDDYIDNLRTFIQRGCFATASDDDDVEYLRMLDVIAVNLERIADFCESIVDQLDHVSDRSVLEPAAWNAFFAEVEAALGMVERAVLDRNVRLALSVCRVEPKLDAMYAQMFRAGIDALGQGQDAHSHVTLLFIWHYFERMGDSLLNIGEAVISAALGEKIKIDQLWALQDSLKLVDPARSIETVQLAPVGESRSGARITRVSTRALADGVRDTLPFFDGVNADDEPPASNGAEHANEHLPETTIIFKEGASEKLREEHASIALWEKLVPGMVPKALSFHENGVNSAILLEYLPGQTFEQIVLRGAGMHAADEALDRVTKTVESVWNRTLLAGAQPSTFVDQLRHRLKDVLAIHPEFGLDDERIGGINMPSLQRLVANAHEIETQLSAPFTVLTHGDLNLDNVICSPDKAVRFIDLHRSRHGDYVQDASVFIVSNFRLQIFEAPVRRRINQVILRFYDFVSEFARKHDDKTFNVRLALGLARSFATSTRFILDEAFATVLFLRARYLLDRVTHCAPSALATFTVPKEVLID